MAAGADGGRKWWIVGAVSLVVPLVIGCYGIVVALPARSGAIQAGMILYAALSLAGVAVAMIGTGPALVADRPPHAV